MSDGVKIEAYFVKESETTTDLLFEVKHSRRVWIPRDAIVDPLGPDPVIVVTTAFAEREGLEPIAAPSMAEP